MEGVTDYKSFLEPIGIILVVALGLGAFIFYVSLDRDIYIERIKKILNLILMFSIGILNSLYTAFVAMCFWNWFAIKALNISSISYPEMVGIVWLISLFTYRGNNDESKWKVLLAAIEACVPEHNRLLLTEVLEEQLENMRRDIALVAFERFVNHTITLVLGFVLHTLIG